MLILGIETSSGTGGIALEKDGVSLGERIFEGGLQHAREIFPALQELFRETGTKVSQLGLVAVSRGPGSFTGVRVGVTMAKTLAFAIGIPAVGVITLDALADEESAEWSCPTLDARMNSVFAAHYHCENGRAKRVSDFWLDTPEVVAAKISPETLVFGDGAARYRERWESAGCLHLRETPNSPRPGTIIRLGREIFELGRASSPLDLAPFYLRRPEAEVKWDRAHGQPSADDLDHSEIERLKEI